MNRAHGLSLIDVNPTHRPLRGLYQVAERKEGRFNEQSRQKDRPYQESAPTPGNEQRTRDASSRQYAE